MLHLLGIKITVFKKILFQKLEYIGNHYTSGQKGMTAKDYYDAKLACCLVAKGHDYFTNVHSCESDKTYKSRLVMTILLTPQ